MKDYAAIATQYARDVVDGRILACKWVRLAGQRHLDDLKRDADGWRYTWNPELTQPDAVDAAGQVKEGKQYRPADRICHFIELLPHIKDDWKKSASLGATIILEAWEVFIVASIFGWVDRQTLRRRFRVADVFVPRKNAKSTLAAAIGLYMLALDGEHGAEVYSGATSEDQAGEVFKPAKLMVERTPDFRDRYGILPRASNISIAGTNSRFEPLIGKPGDGASPSCAIVDEYHEHPTSDLYDTMRTGMGARSQPLMLVISTAGDDIACPCYVHQEELQQILEGVIEDDQRFGVIYTIDVDADGKFEDWTTEQALIKANPNYGISIDPEFLLVQQRDAIRDARKQATFQTKHLNLWVQASSPAFNVHLWKLLGDKTLKLDQFRGERCHDGADLANTTDIASTVKVFKREVEGVAHYYCFWRHYLPAKVIEEPDNRHYQGWKRDGRLIETPGNMIDQAQIEADFIADASRFLTIEAAVDGWGSPGFSATLQNSGYTVVIIPMVTKHLSPAMKFIDGLIKSERIHHDGDPIAAWGLSNVQNKPDANDNWFPRRGSRKKKIDPAVALTLAMVRAMVAEPGNQFTGELRVVEA